VSDDVNFSHSYPLTLSSPHHQLFHHPSCLVRYSTTLFSSLHSFPIRFACSVSHVPSKSMNLQYMPIYMCVCGCPDALSYPFRAEALHSSEPGHPYLSLCTHSALLFLLLSGCIRIPLCFSESLFFVSKLPIFLTLSTLSTSSVHRSASFVHGTQTTHFSLLFSFPHINLSSFFLFGHVVSSLLSFSFGHEFGFSFVTGG
jgi:hypothetical protein